MSRLSQADPPHAFEIEVLESARSVVVGSCARAAIESDLGIASGLGRTA